MDEARELEDMLPMSFRASSEQAYLEYLWEGVEENFERQKYQLSFLAYHMIMMSFFYFKIWQLRRACPEEYEAGIRGFRREHRRELRTAQSPFVFSSVSESRILALLSIIGCSNNKIKRYANLVRTRNEIAHCNGRIVIRDEKAFDENVSQVIEVANEVQTYQAQILEGQYEGFLIQSHDPERREYSHPTDQIREVLIHENYMSWRDLSVCVDLNISNLAGASDQSEIHRMHRRLHEIYGF